MIASMSVLRIPESRREAGNKGRNSSGEVFGTRLSTAESPGGSRCSDGGASGRVIAADLLAGAPMSEQSRVSDASSSKRNSRRSRSSTVHENQ